MFSLTALRRGAIQIGSLALVCALGALTLQIDLGRTEFPIILRSLVYGCLTALFAVGLVLIYRASRVINFAQAGFGLIAGTLFFELLSYKGYSYWLAVPAALAAAALSGAVVELLLIRRFFGTARLVLTVVTIGIGQLLAGLAGAIPTWLGDHNNRPGVPLTPLSHFQWQLFPVVFTGNDIAIVVLTVAALGGLVAFFRLTKVGVAIRGAAENDDLASLLGVNTRSLSTLVWTLGALLAGAAAVLQIPVLGYSNSANASALGVGTLLVALAAAVIGGMENLPVTVVAALAIAVFQQVVFAVFSQQSVGDVAILGLLLVVFVVRRRSLARTDESSTSTWAATEEVRPVPAELAGLPSVRSGLRRVVFVLAVVVLAYPIVMSPSQTNQGSLFLIYGMVIISLVILTGWGGQVSLGQFAFVAVGALVGGALTSKVGLPFFLALVLGALAGAAVAVVLGLTALRVRGLYLAVTTLSFSVVTATFLLDHAYFGWLIADRVNRPTLLFVKTDKEPAFYYLCLAALGLTWLAALGLRRSRTGRVLIAMRDNERGAQAFGVNLVRTRLATFALSGFVAAAAGVLFAAHQHGVSSTAFTPDTSVQIFLTAIIGGLGSIEGALLGAIYFAVVNLALHGAVAHLLASSFGVLLVLLFFPGGLGALAYQARDAVLRRIAIRRRIYVPSLLEDRHVAAGQDRAALAPLPAVNGRVAEVPVKYRLKSRIGLAGASQSGRRWTFDG